MKKLFVVGLGPGLPEGMTQQAAAVLETAEVLCGYTGYIDLIRDRYPGKELLATPMKREIERCRAALQRADSGCTVAMVCSGDAGVYGMASPILELLPDFPDVDVEIVPGVTAALSGGAVLGAPLGHDFALISLSDLLTPWELIEKRLHLAAAGDLVLCLYNPSSKKRADYLQKACDILLQTVDGNRVCGLVRNIGRDGQQHRILSLAELRETPVDMFTTVFIGNSCTKEVEGRMVTPRGYAAT